MSAVGEPMRERVALAPPALAQRVRAALGGDRAPGDDCGRCLDAGEALLGALLRDGCSARNSAVDLLAADALVTYAFEAAADDPHTIATRAARAMVRIAAVAEPRDGSA